MVLRINLIPYFCVHIKVGLCIPLPYPTQNDRHIISKRSPESIPAAGDWGWADGEPKTGLTL
ncbi:uncharacterized protein FFB20_06646 [Fusarium fujikuroi]|nr:uncharacterized protein FFB20_06646 [Fusarium fujikuroi]SCO11491.1 uncharacterized protein FFC1_11514 [Fusarium fujikuroi]SCO13973.1 uncharacterized protein FFE2_13024 [Fusarium fujikuroi]SCO18786.1 uncharacterized protein FFM5_11947 [Fusarium fujikuroi]SCO40586.1 uncharacterized protein FFNC_07563 [Fusarium fujikuroi]